MWRSAWCRSQRRAKSKSPNILTYSGSGVEGVGMIAVSGSCTIRHSSFRGWQRVRLLSPTIVYASAAAPYGAAVGEGRRARRHCTASNDAAESVVVEVEVELGRERFRQSKKSTAMSFATLWRVAMIASKPWSL